MSQENIKATQRIIEKFNQRDLSDWEAEYAPDYEFFPRLMGAMEGESFQGREGMERYFQMVEDIFDEWRVIPEEVRELPGQVLVRLRVEGRGRGSDVPVAGSQSVLIDFRDGRVSRTRSYLDETEALLAAGMDK